MSFQVPWVLSGQEFRLFQALLLEESGLFFETEQADRLGRAVATGMAKYRLDHAEAYYALLKSPVQGPFEMKALINSLTIGETYFFRNLAQFDVLRNALLPALIESRFYSSKKLTLWSAACSTGEEPYSLAILLLETLPCPDAWDISLLATDVNQDHLQKAQEAAYGPRAVHLVPPGWLAKYFSERGGKHVLNDAAKRRVRFACHNLAKDPFALPGMQAVDILFCRNVIIYFSRETIQRILDQFADCLQGEGRLFLGDAETLWQISERFIAEDFPQALVYRKGTAAGGNDSKPFVSLPEPALLATLPADPGVPVPAETPAPPRTSPDLPGGPAYEQGVQALVEKDYERALADFDQAIQTSPNLLRAYIGKASVLADQGRYEEAIGVLNRSIQIDNLSSQAHYLLGLLFEKTGRLEQAVESLHRALYVDPTISLAYVALADIYRCQSQPAKARRELQNALKSLEGKSDEDPISFSEGVTCGYLRIACQRNLEQLQPALKP